MKTLYKRIERLSARIRPGPIREFTLEELCRLYWRMNKRGFKAFAKGSPFQFFADCFEREDADCAARGTPGRKSAPARRERGRVSRMVGG
jgi:hypothetical protein